MNPYYSYTVILEVVVGSTVHGTSVEDGLEDLDLMAVAVEDMTTACGFNPTDTWTERTKPMGVRSEAGDVDRTVYGLRKFLSLALKGNPSILLAFFVPSSFIRRADIHNLQSIYPYIVSQKAFDPFRGYMRQQHERLLGLRGQRNVTRPELVTAYGYDTKYAAHIVRLGMQGEELLTTGKLTLPMPEEQRNKVRAVRQGTFTLAQISEQIIDAEERIVKAKLNSTIRETPDYRFVEHWMLEIYRRYWKHQPPVTTIEI